MGVQKQKKREKESESEEDREIFYLDSVSTAHPHSPPRPHAPCEITSRGQRGKGKFFNQQQNSRNFNNNNKRNFTNNTNFENRNYYENNYFSVRNRKENKNYYNREKQHESYFKNFYNNDCEGETRQEKATNIHRKRKHQRNNSVTSSPLHYTHGETYTKYPHTHTQKLPNTDNFFKDTIPI